MGYKIEFNTILSAPEGQIDLKTLEVGRIYTITKAGERIFPLNIPIDLSDSSYKFLAKVIIRKLILSKGKTELTVEIFKIFNLEESKVISQNFQKEA